MRFHELPNIEGLDISKQNKSTIRMEIKIQRYAKYKVENEEGEESYKGNWLIDSHNDYNGKLLLDKNIIIDLKNNYSLDFDDNFKKESYKGDIDDLKSFLRKNFIIDKNLSKDENSSDETIIYFCRNENTSLGNFDEDDLRVSVTFVNKFY